MIAFTRALDGLNMSEGVAMPLGYQPFQICGIEPERMGGVYGTMQGLNNTRQHHTEQEANITNKAKTKKKGSSSSSNNPHLNEILANHGGDTGHHGGCHARACHGPDLTTSFFAGLRLHRFSSSCKYHAIQFADGRKHAVHARGRLKIAKVRRETTPLEYILGGIEHTDELEHCMR